MALFFAFHIDFYRIFIDKDREENNFLLLLKMRALFFLMQCFVYLKMLRLLWLRLLREIGEGTGEAPEEFLAVPEIASSVAKSGRLLNEVLNLQD